MRVPHHEMACDYAIIGAGICGLATAEILANRFPGARVVLFEREAKLGGRVRSQTLDREGNADLAVIELGAGRYHPKRHRRVNALIGELGIETRPFAFEMVRYTPGADAIDTADVLERLHRLRETAPAGASFRTVVTAELGAVGFEVLVQMSGYDTLRRNELPFVHGLEIISAHPETETIWTGDVGEWRSASSGFDQLTERLAQRLEGRATIQFNHRVEQLLRDDGKVVGLEAIGPKGRVKVHCQQVICATSLYDLLTLSMPACAAVDYRADVVDVPLVKGYIEFERPFWPQAGRAHGICSVSTSAFRKLYFSASRPRMFFYCDGCSAVRLTDQLTKQSLPDQFLCDLPLILPEADPLQVRATRWGAQHWDRGISFWAGGKQLVEGPVWMPEPGLAFLSDINTAELGWLEGALLAAEAVSDRVTAPFKRNDRPAIAPTQTSYH